MPYGENKIYNLSRHSPLKNEGFVLDLRISSLELMLGNKPKYCFGYRWHSYSVRVGRKERDGLFWCWKQSIAAWEYSAVRYRDSWLLIWRPVWVAKMKKTGKGWLWALQKSQCSRVKSGMGRVAWEGGRRTDRVRPWKLDLRGWPLKNNAV